MSTKHKEQYLDWYTLWMKQSKEFFDSAQENLNLMFKENKAVNPSEHLDEIHAWLKSLKNKWEFIELNEQQKKYSNYWKMLTTMSIEASDLMLKEWIKRSQQKDPIKNIRELYELWLNCCQSIYKKSMETKIFQEAYGEYMNAAFKYWQSIL